MWFEKGLDHPQSDYADVQLYAVQTAEPNAILVEVGSFVGESIAHLIDLVQVHGKTDLKLYAVDLFDIGEMCADGGHAVNARMNNDGLTPEKWVAQYGPRCMLAEFYKNLYHRDRDLWLTGALVGKSVDMAALFADKSVHFCYIDAGHTFENVTADLRAWFPKVKDGGILAGHDWYSSAELRRAVTEFAKGIGYDLIITDSSWVLVKPGVASIGGVVGVAPKEDAPAA